MKSMPDIWMLDPDGFTPDYNLGLATNLARLGWTVHCIGFDLFNPNISPEEGLRMEPGFHAIWGKYAGSRPLMATHSRLLRRTAKAACYPCELAILYRHLRQSNPGILHVQWAPAPPLDMFFWKQMKRRGWAIVYTIHDPTYLPGSPHQRFGNWVRPLSASAQSVVVHSQNARQALHKQRIDFHSMRVIPPGANRVDSSFNRAEARKSLNLPVDADMILFFGYVKRYKGLRILLQALPQIMKERKDAFLVVAGEWQDDRSLYRELTSRNSSEMRIFLREHFIPESRVQEYFAAADVVALPYTEASSSGVLLKAYALGCPVVATRVGGFPELVEENRSGILVDPQDTQALASAILKLLENPSLASQLVKRGRALLHQTFSWENAAKQTASLYSEIWDRNSRNLTGI